MKPTSRVPPAIVVAVVIVAAAAVVAVAAAAVVVAVVASAAASAVVAAAAVVPVEAIGKMDGAAMGVAAMSVAEIAVAAATVRNSLPKVGMDSLPAGRENSLPFHNTMSMFGSRATHNCRPSPTSYRPHVRASTDSRLNPYEIPCSRHHPLIYVFLPSPADPSLHNSESIHKSLTLDLCISLRTPSSICTKDIIISSYNSIILYNLVVMA